MRIPATKPRHRRKPACDCPTDGSSAPLPLPYARYHCLSLPRPEFETLGLEPWESSLRGPSDTPSAPTEETASGAGAGMTTAAAANAAAARAAAAVAAVVAGDSKTEQGAPGDPVEERLHLIRLTDSLSRGMWPTYARLACALNLLALRAMHSQLCGSLASLIWREDYRARAPLASRVCGAVPFHPAGEGGVALGSELKTVENGEARGGGGGGGGEGAFPSSATFYSAFLHPLYVWAQCLDRQFYAQVRE